MAVIVHTVASYLADGASQPYAGADDVTIADTGANIAALSTLQLDDVGTNNVDFLDATDNVISFSVAQFITISGISTFLTDADVITLADTGANIAALSAVDIGLLDVAGVDFDAIDSSTGALALTKAKLDALGTVTLTAGDEVSFADTQANIEALSPANFTAYIALGVDIFDSSTNELSFTLAEYTALSSVVFGDDDVVTITATAGNDIISGTAASEILQGGVGKDTITGGAGDDTLEGGAGKDSLNGGDDDDSLSGGDKKDIITGGNGNDTLDGGAGKDILTGGAGDDVFLFDDVAKRTSQDLISDFVSGTDIIQLDLSVFTALAGVGTLTAAEFFIGKEVHDASDRIVYNPANGRVYYDADGVGAIDKIRIATIGSTTHPTLTEADFEVIA